MRYYALACDYDGTVADQGVLLDSTRAALGRLRASGRKLLLVTGRRIDDLHGVCPDLSIFDSVVAENGAVLYHPATREVRALAARPPDAFVRELQARGVDRLDVGHVIVATWQPHETTVLEVIRALGLELQVIFNKGAVMILPTGVNKATGLDVALAELGLSAHNVVAVGDAENDHAFLGRCELGVAVDNAIPSLKQQADHVTAAARGAGVAELIDLLVADDLRSVSDRVRRNDVLVGHRPDGEPVAVPGQRGALLYAGPSGAGKSAAVTGFVEHLAERRYQHCIIDPEGDYASYEGGVVLGDARRAPTVDEVADALAAPDRNVVVSLLGLSIDDRPVFWTSLWPRLLELRARVGRPHWIVVDESHHLFPEGWQPGSPASLEELRGLVLVTVHPERVARALLRTVDLLLATGRAPAETVRGFAAAVDRAAPSGVDAIQLEAGELLLWRPNGAAPPERVRALLGRTERQRHARKYADGELGVDKSFFFRGPEGRLNLRVQNLRLFLQVADGVDEATWLHHLRQGDYSRWVRQALKDEGLANAISSVERRSSQPGGVGPGAADDTRAAVRAAIESRYTAPG